MTINGIVADTQAIGEGIYKLICEQGDEALVAFGMLPVWAMDACEKMLRERVIAESAKQIGITPDELKPHIDKELLAQITRPIMREICSEIYGAAQRAGKLIV